MNIIRWLIVYLGIYWFSSILFMFVRDNFEKIYALIIFDIFAATTAYGIASYIEKVLKNKEEKK